MASENPASAGSSQPIKNSVEQDPKSRFRKQLNILFAGAGFVLLSARITRRAVNRRVRWAKPTYFRPNMQHPEQKINGTLEAMEALSVATVNVFSWSFFLIGGAMLASDTSNLEEIRGRLRLRGVTEEEQKDSHQLLGEWIDAAKPWNAFKKEQPETLEAKTTELKKETADKANGTSQS